MHDEIKEKDLILSRIDKIKDLLKQSECIYKELEKLNDRAFLNDFHIRSMGELKTFMRSIERLLDTQRVSLCRASGD